MIRKFRVKNKDYLQSHTDEGPGIVYKMIWRAGEIMEVSEYNITYNYDEDEAELDYCFPGDSRTFSWLLSWLIPIDKIDNEEVE